MAFNRNHYCIDITFYYRILADAIVGGTKPATLCGLAVLLQTRRPLAGEDSCAKIFTSDTVLGDLDGRTRSFNHPTAVVEVLDPHDSLRPHSGGLRLPRRRALSQSASHRHPESL